MNRRASTWRESHSLGSRATAYGTASDGPTVAIHALRPTGAVARRASTNGSRSCDETGRRLTDRDVRSAGTGTAVLVGDSSFYGCSADITSRPGNLGSAIPTRNRTVSN